MTLPIIDHYPLVSRIRQEKTFRTPRNMVLKLLIFVGIFYIGELLAGLPICIAAFPKLMEWAMEKMETSDGVNSLEAVDQLTSIMNDVSNVRVMLFSFGLMTITALIFCRCIEGRRLLTMGFRKKGALLQYLLGLLVGFVMFSALVGLSLLFGGLHFDGYQLKEGEIVGLLIMFCGYVIQGMSEEVLCRGYILTSITRHYKPVWGILLNSGIFSLLHLGNPGFGIMQFINIMLFGILMSLYVFRTDNLWGACALHSIWNFAQGNFYGLPVSGLNSGEHVFSMSLKGSDFVNGGTFGLEGGIGCTIVTLVVIAIRLFVPFGKKTAPAKQEVSA